MKKIILTATALMMTAGVAIAQTSSTDKPAPSGSSQSADPKQSSPGATGAMQNEVGGVATSPQDVQKQGGAATAPKTDGNSESAGKTTGGGGGEKPK